MSEGEVIGRDWRVQGPLRPLHQLLWQRRDVSSTLGTSCRRGNKCKFPHNWKEIGRAQRKNKCLVCGSTAHRAKECKAPGGGPVQPTSSQPSTTTSPKEEAVQAQAKSVTFEGVGQHVAPAGKGAQQATTSNSSSSTSGYEMKEAAHV